MEQKELKERIIQVQEEIAAAAQSAGRSPSEITLVAATKMQSSEVVREAIGAGIVVCGENRVQEMTDKLGQNAYEGAALHFIGHLQTNKVKQVAGKVALLHSVDSPRLLLETQRVCAALHLVQDILLEVNVGGEESKGGVSPHELLSLAEQAMDCPHVRLRGLMCIPPPALQGGNAGHFAQMRHLFVDIKEKLADNSSHLDCLSMGMSNDYRDAVREGATLVRVGTALFGPRHVG